MSESYRVSLRWFYTEQDAGALGYESSCNSRSHVYHSDLIYYDLNKGI